MTLRNRFLITAALLCHLLLAPPLVTSQLLPEDGSSAKPQGEVSSEKSATAPATPCARAFAEESQSSNRLCHPAGREGVFTSCTARWKSITKLMFCGPMKLPSTLTPTKSPPADISPSMAVPTTITFAPRTAPTTLRWKPANFTMSSEPPGCATVPTAPFSLPPLPSHSPETGGETSAGSLPGLRGHNHHLRVAASELAI